MNGLFRWIAPFAAIAMLTVWSQLQTRQLGYEVAELTRLDRQLSADKRELEAKLAELASPERLDRIARNELGLGDPAPGQVRWMQ